MIHLDYQSSLNNNKKDITAFYSFRRGAMKTQLFSYPMVAAYGGITAGFLGSIGDGLLVGTVYGLILGGLFFVATYFIEKLIVNYKKSG